MNPKYGYYMTKRRELTPSPSTVPEEPSAANDRKGIFGRSGDFVTAPEISSMFGESLAMYFVSKWRELGSARRVKLLELGPGRGTLLADILSQSRRSFPDFYNAIESVNLVEISPALREEQRQTLAPHVDSDKLRHLDTVNDFLPDVGAESAVATKPAADDRNNVFILSHEFFDCLGVNVYERVDGVWNEKFLDFDFDTDEFRFVLHPLDATVRRQLLDSSAFHLPPTQQYASATPLRSASKRRARTAADKSMHAMTQHANARIADVSAPFADELTRNLTEMAAATPPHATGDLSRSNYVEVSFDALQIFERTAQLLEARGGVQVLVDYGNVRVDYPSLRFITAHRIVDTVDSDFIKAHVGDVDVSVDVHFAPLMALANKHGLSPLLSSQAAFLRRCAIEPVCTLNVVFVHCCVHLTYLQRAVDGEEAHKVSHISRCKSRDR
jgi:SAM-dependent MidA family methyltransferase